MSSQVRVYSKYTEQRINDLTQVVADNKVDIETKLDNYKSSNDARVLAAEGAHASYVSSNNARVSSLESTVSNNKSLFDAYKASNDARSSAIEAQAVADKNELQNNIDAVSSQLSADKLELQNNINSVNSALDARLGAVEAEVGDKVNDYLNSNIDQRVLTTTFEAVKTSLENQDTAFASELSTKISESITRNNAQAGVLNELIRYMKIFAKGVVVEDETTGDIISLDELKLVDTTSA